MLEISSRMARSCAGPELMLTCACITCNYIGSAFASRKVTSYNCKSRAEGCILFMVPWLTEASASAASIAKVSDCVSERTGPERPLLAAP